MDRFLTFNYWFALETGGTFAGWKYAAMVALVFFILSIVIYIAYKLKLYKSPYKKIYRSSSSWLLFFSVATMVFVFFRWENAKILSMRIWFVVLGIVFVLWVLFLIRAILKEKNRILLREQLHEIKTKENKAKLDDTFTKYLPKPKKKKRK